MTAAPERPTALVICTANVCRSPVVEQLLPRHFAAAGLDLAATSAGTHGGRNVVHPDTVAVAAAIGVDLSHHHSRRLTRRLLDAEGHELVVTVARDHLYHVIATDEGVWRRTFTLRELTRRSAALAGDGVRVDSFAEWVAALSEGRTSADLLPGREDDDIADPYGRSRRHHRAMVRHVDELCAAVARDASEAVR